MRPCHRTLLAYTYDWWCAAYASPREQREGERFACGFLHRQLARLSEPAVAYGT